MIDIIKNAMLRKIGYSIAAVLIALVFSLLGVGTAYAHDTVYTQQCQGQPAAGQASCDEGLAHDLADNFPLEERQWHCAATNGGSPSDWNTTQTIQRSGVDRWVVKISCGYQQSTPQPTGQHTFWYGATCASRNVGIINGAVRNEDWRDGTSDCLAGCIFAIEGTPSTLSVFGSDAGAQPVTTTLYKGTWGYTGDLCPANTPSKPRTEESKSEEPDCVPAGNNQTYCVYKDGKSCSTASTGRVICFQASENTSKTDGPVTKTKSIGDQPPANIDGSDHKNKTVEQTVINNISTTTTTNTYSTSNGGPAGANNQGQNSGADGAPTGGTPGGGGTGDEEGEENGSSGGTSCGDPPVSTGDALLAQIARQAWETRCSISERNEEQDRQVGELSTDDGTGAINESDIFAPEGDGTIAINEGLISGGGGGMCSLGSLSLMGEPIEIPAPFWDLAGWISTLMIGLAYLWVAQKLGS